VKGKFLFLGEQKFFVRGVTYGTFALDDQGREIHDPEVVERDFAAMAAAGLNSVRVYTVLERWVLDAAYRHGLYVMVGLPWEQHVDFLEDEARANDIEQRVREAARACAGHPALLCYAIGNEIPAPIVRWLGARRVERFLRRLYDAVKGVDPEALVTYVNFPSTEYLQLPFVDLFCFNVYLESQERLEAYLARLHNLAGDRPVLMAEVGLDSLRNGDQKQAEVLDWQVRTTFAAGCAGTFVFAWTDEWYRGGSEIQDWDFGLTTRDREPKLALEVVSRAFAEVPFPPELGWPRISVVVCTYNGNRTIRETMEGLRRLDYPDYEIIVVDDGSTVKIEPIVRPYGVKYIRTENRGLSSARNTGLEAATGEIVAYIDDDAFPDPHWLTHLAATFRSGDYAGVGGPNIPVLDDGLVADCVAHSPGGPIHVLLNDRDAEHIPGCNSSFRKDALQSIGGFDARFRVAGDDVDLCWRLLDRGWKIGFSPAAVVWHHRRNSVRAYLRQQRGYGKAEAMLERKWPEKYNRAGHIPWAGRIYVGYLTTILGSRRGRIYQGTWGTALFQSVYQPAPGALRSLVMMPEWYLVIVALLAVSLIGIAWAPLLWAIPLLAICAGASVVHAMTNAAGVVFAGGPRSRASRLKRYALTAFLHLAQPMVRLYGRLYEGLTPWRRLNLGNAAPIPRVLTLWSEDWQAPETRLQAIEASLWAQRATPVRGGNYDRWDLEVHGGMFGGIRMLSTVEEHGAGRQLTRLRVWPRYTYGAPLLITLFAALAAGAVADQAWAVAGGLGLLVVLMAARVASEISVAMAALIRSVELIREAERVVREEVVWRQEKRAKALLDAPVASEVIDGSSGTEHAREPAVVGSLRRSARRRQRWDDPVEPRL
jgi:GT2 family glycosyltransferase